MQSLRKETGDARGSEYPGLNAKGCLQGRLGEAGFQAPVTDDGLCDCSGLCSAPGPVLAESLRGPFKLLRVSPGQPGGRPAPLLEKQLSPSHTASHLGPTMGGSPEATAGCPAGGAPGA